MPREADDRAAQVHALLAGHLPGFPLRSVALLGEGQDNIAYEVNGELIVRFSKEPDPALRAERVRREARLLAMVARISPLPVPDPGFVAAEQGCLAYAKMPGVPLLDMGLARRAGPAGHGAAVAATLGGLLAALHAVPAARVANLVGTDDQPLAGWLADAAGLFAMAADQVPVTHHQAITAFFGAPPPPDGYGLAFSHNDLGIEHVLVDPASWAVTGILDWGDAAITDPAYDFGLLCRDLGPAALDAALGSYRAAGGDDGGLAERAVFYARCSVLEDLAYGVQTGRDAYLTRSLAALDWLFTG